MAKLRQLTDPQHPECEEWAFTCPGCGHAHWVRVKGPRPCWGWNGSTDKPTFTPSVFVGPDTSSSCHSFVTDGRIRFLGDCWHPLAGQTVELPEWEP